MSQVTKARENMITIDATGRRLGRVSSEIATLLMGKNTRNFQRHIALDVSVTVSNASKMDFSKKKLKTKIYTHYSGYPSGLKKQSAQQIIDKKGYSELIKKAVKGMLPGNKLKDIRMKNLTITE